MTDQGTHEVYSVTTAGTVVFRYGKMGTPGQGTDELNGPYDAKVNGDFTGLTLPPAGEN